MSFPDAIRTVLSKYATFAGRARRSEYWWFILFNMLVSLVAGAVDGMLDTYIVRAVVTLALFLPGLAVLVRRLHDTGRSGWWVLIGLVPLVGFITLIVFAALNSEPGTNRFGSSPKQAAEGTGMAPAQA